MLGRSSAFVIQLLGLGGGYDGSPPIPGWQQIPLGPVPEHTYREATFEAQGRAVSLVIPADGGYQVWVNEKEGRQCEHIALGSFLLAPGGERFAYVVKGKG